MYRFFRSIKYPHGYLLFQVKVMISQRRICLQRLLHSNIKTVSLVFKADKSHCFYHRPVNGVAWRFEVNLHLAYGNRNFLTFSHANPREVIPKKDFWCQMRHKFAEGLVLAEAKRLWPHLLELST